MPVPEPRLPPGEVPARPEIAASWRRAQLSGLPPDSPLDRVRVADIDRRSRLMVAAGPVMAQLTVQLDDTTLALALADHQSRLVDLRFTDRRVGAALENISAIPGSQYSEETSGTNSVATPLVTRTGITVNGAEHYLERLKAFSCYGHPILHPVTRRLEGVLDITGIMPFANPLFGPLVKRAVHDIEQRLLQGSTLAEQFLLAAFRAVAGRARGVVVLGDDVVLANPHAVDMLEAGDHAVLRGLAPDLRDGESVTRDLTLISGRSVSAHVERIDGTDGTLVQLVPRDEPVRRWHAAGTAGSPVDRELAQLAASTSTVLVSGEPGTGRSTAVRTIAGDEPVNTLDAAAVASLGQREWVRKLERYAGAEGVLAVEDIQLLPRALAVRLARLLESATARIVLTSGPRDQLSGDVAGLAALCVSAVELPPLRNRRDELPAMVQRILGELRPGGVVRFTPSALQALAAHQWPGNLRELRVVIQHAVEHRSTGDITARDLPPSHRGDPKVRTLTPWEQAEHDAIVAALRATVGNKARAAARLGISRSTLYNRIRQLRISL